MPAGPWLAAAAGAAPTVAVCGLPTPTQKRHQSIDGSRCMQTSQHAQHLRHA